jgi:prepilin-type N-terminal cleavage/methylation domain-containing protein
MKRPSLHAFTLTEVLIALALSSFFSIAVFRLMRTQVLRSTDQITASQNSRSSQRARALMMSDVEEAGFDPRYVDQGRSAIVPLTYATNDSFTTQGDFNMNGSIDASVDPPETVAYLYDAASGNVTRNGDIFLTGVQSFSITYYNALEVSASGVPSTQIASLSQVKKMRIKWTQQGEGSKTLAQEIVVSLRNYR